MTERRSARLYFGRTPASLEWRMRWERLHLILQPETSGGAARAFRIAHHSLVLSGIAIMLADTVAPWRQAHERLLDIAFQIVCACFIGEYLLRLAAAPGAPGAHRRAWQARLAWLVSPAGLFEVCTTGPGFLIDQSLDELGDVFSLPERLDLVRADAMNKRLSSLVSLPELKKLLPCCGITRENE